MNINRQFIFDIPVQTVMANTMSFAKAILNLGLLMLGIGICFYGAMYEKNIVCGFTVLALLVLHVASSQDQFAEASVIILVGIVGGAIELINTTLGLYAYSTATFNYALLPTWIVTIWFVIGATVRHTFRWLSSRPAVASIMGIMLGSLTYFVASRLGVIQLAGIYDGFAVIAGLLWAVAFPVIIFIGHRLLPVDSANSEQKDLYGKFRVNNSYD